MRWKKERSYIIAAVSLFETIVDQLKIPLWRGVDGGTPVNPKPVTFVFKFKFFFFFRFGPMVPNYPREPKPTIYSKHEPLSLFD